MNYAKRVWLPAWSIEKGVIVKNYVQCTPILHEFSRLKTSDGLVPELDESERYYYAMIKDDSDFCPKNLTFNYEDTVFEVFDKAKVTYGVGYSFQAFPQDWTE